MKKIVLTYGLISGIIVSVLMGASMVYWGCQADTNLAGSMALGYATMILAFVLIYFAQARYRDQVGDGHITYGKAFSVGILVALISSLCYVITWMFLFAYVMPDFMDKYVDIEIARMTKSGMSAEQIAAAKMKMEESGRLYKENAFYRAGITFMEIFPVGLLVTIISSFLVRMKKKKSSLAS